MINYINDTEELVETFTQKVLPTYSIEEWAQMAYKFRKRNWTSQGTYIYLKWSPLSKETQDELMTLLERNEISDLQDEIYPDYYELLWEEITTEWDLTDELQGIEKDTDEYYNIIHELVVDTMDINPPQHHLILAIMDKIEDYYNEYQNENL